MNLSGERSPVARWPAYKHVIFDCDATLAGVEGIDSLADGEAAERIAALTAQAMAGEVALEDVYGTRLSSLRPTREAVGRVRDTYRRSAVPGALEVVRALLDLGHEVYVVSGGLAEPVREFATRLGIPVRNVRAVEVHHDALSGRWWTGDETAGQAFAGHERSVLTTSTGKAAVVRELLDGLSGSSLLVGDGLTDLAASDEVDLFVAFGGVVDHEIVTAGADICIRGSCLDPVLAIAGGTLARLASGDAATTTLRNALDEVAIGNVTFADRDLEQKFRRAFELTEDQKLMDNTQPRKHVVLVCDVLGAAGTDLLHGFDDVDLRIETDLSRTELLEAVGDVDAIIVRSATTIDGDVIAAAESLRIVGRAGVGTDNIDLDAATRRGIMVTNTPHANTIATAEQTFALMLATARNTAHAHGSMAAGEWSRASFIGVELNAKTLGVVGFGRVGRAVAARAKAFGMQVMAYDPYVSELVGREHGVVLSELDDLLARSDFVTLHAVPPSDGSAILDASAISLMKPGSTIINAARGQLLDDAAAREALDSGHLRGVAVDVYDVEPPVADHPLVGHPRVVHTPHLGASTAEAQRDVSIQVVEQVLAGLRGEGLSNCVNVPFAFDVETEAQLKLARAMGKLQSVMADAPIERVEVDVTERSDDLLATVAAGFLSGMLDESSNGQANFVSAPALAHENGITVAQGQGLGSLDYPNLISCRVVWDGGDRTMSGVVFGAKEPRIVQISNYHLDARPEGIVLVMLNRDVAGVIGEVGTLLGSLGVNIAEWRLGRNEMGGLALSFINLDVRPDPEVLETLRGVEAVTKAEVVEL